MFSLICAWINDWVNNREAGDLRRHCDHYDVNVMGTWITSMYFTGFAQFCISCWYAHLFKFAYISLTPSGIPNEPCEGYTVTRRPVQLSDTTVILWLMVAVSVVLWSSISILWCGQFVPRSGIQGIVWYWFVHMETQFGWIQVNLADKMDNTLEYRTEYLTGRSHLQKKENQGWF